MLVTQQSDLDSACLDHSLRTNSIKIILSAMWFTDTAGVDNILVEYRPPKSELSTPAYKFYSAIYRLCYSFHSSLEEIVDFVDTLRPNKLYSIALPDSTSEQQINEYFFDTDNRFIGFHQVQTVSSCNEKNVVKTLSPIKKRTFNDTLMLRKRKPCEFLGEAQGCKATSDSSDISSHSDDGLVFGGLDSSDEIDCKKLKCTKR